MLVDEVDFLERFAAARQAGFRSVEYLFPYACPKEKSADQLDQNRRAQLRHSLPAGDGARSERGIAALADRVREFQDGVGEAIDYVRALGFIQINCMAGIAPVGTVRADGHKVFERSDIICIMVRALEKPANFKIEQDAN